MSFTYKGFAQLWHLPKNEHMQADEVEVKGKGKFYNHVEKLQVNIMHCFHLHCERENGKQHSACAMYSHSSFSNKLVSCDELASYIQAKLVSDAQCPTSVQHPMSNLHLMSMMSSHLAYSFNFWVEVIGDGIVWWFSIFPLLSLTSQPSTQLDKFPSTSSLSIPLLSLPFP